MMDKLFKLETARRILQEALDSAVRDWDGDDPMDVQDKWTPEELQLFVRGRAYEGGFISYEIRNALALIQEVINEAD